MSNASAARNPVERFEQRFSIALYVDVTGLSASQVVLGGILFTLSLTLGTQRRNLDFTNGKTLQTSKSIPTILSLPIIGNVDHLPLLVQYTLNQ